MNTALWIVAGVLAAAFAGSGLMKLLVPKDKLVNAGQGWAADVSAGNVRLIGLAELLGAVGLIVPALVHIAPILVPLAAVGLVLVMVGAGVVHARRKEVLNIAVNVVLLALAVFVAWGRFGPYAFAS
jgi:DoxX-like family